MALNIADARKKLAEQVNTLKKVQTAAKQVKKK